MGRLPDAVTLYAYADMIQRELLVPVPASSKRSRDGEIDGLRSQMNPDEFDRAWEAGEAMDRDDAVALALGASVAVKDEDVVSFGQGRDEVIWEKLNRQIPAGYPP